MATANMTLVLPVVGVTVGPTYATLNNTAFETIDTHDHTTGNGVQVPTAGININANLEFNSNAAVELTFAAFESTTTPGTNRSLWTDATGDIYYKNSSGTDVQITNGSAIAAVGSGVWTYSAPSSYPYSVVTGDTQKVLGVDPSSAKTLNLPAATNVMFFAIKDITGTAATNNITVAPNGGDSIEGVAGNYTINEGYASRMLMSDGVSAWHII